MKFILEYVTCCVTTTTTTPCNSKAPPSLGTEEKARSLVAASLAPHRRRKATAADWRPSLNAIAEDKAVAAELEKKKLENFCRPVTRPQIRKNVNRCGPSSGRVNARSSSNDFSREPLPLVVPTFCAAPFMF